MLTALAGNALVQAMVTDGWDGVRHKIARLFGRGRPDPTIERRLDTTRAQLAAAVSSELGQLQAAVAAHWQVRFADLLADYPDAADELDAVVQEMTATIGPVGDHSAAAGRDIAARADHGSVAVNVAHGPITVGPTPPGPPQS
jgi:hypothetical protein